MRTGIISAVMLVWAMTGVAFASVDFKVSDGNWTNGNAWITLSAPGASDDACIMNGGTAHLMNNVACKTMIIGGYTTGLSGALLIESGGLTLSSVMYVGYSKTTGVVTQSIGSVSCTQLGVGMYGTPKGNGKYTMNGGSLAATTGITLGHQANALFTHNAGTVTTPSVVLGSQVDSFGRYEFNGGNLNSLVYVGVLGRGEFVQTNGVITLSGGFQVPSNTGTGTYEMVGGSLLGNWNAVRVGGFGLGTILLGNASSSGSIPSTQSALYVGSGPATGGKEGLFRGWGKVNWTGILYLYRWGRILADGYGIDRDLDFSTMNSATAQSDGNSTGKVGWYAQDHGRLILPSITLVAGNSSTNWGQSAAMDIVNGVRLATVCSGATTLSGALLATDRLDVSPTRVRGIGVWNFTLGTPANLTAATLTFRYDQSTVAALGITEAQLKVMRRNGDKWTDVTASVNTGAHTITTTSLSSLGQFAVGMPPVPYGTLLSIR